MFNPSIKILKAARDSSWIEVVDTTATEEDGWGGAGNPASADDITLVGSVIKPYGGVETSINSINVAGNIETGVVITNNFPDGEYNIALLYGVQLSEYAIDGTDLVVGSSESIEGVNYITSLSDPNTLYEVQNINTETNTITLYTVPSFSASDTIVKFYRAEVEWLNVNTGDANLISDISTMALSEYGCDKKQSTDLMDRVMLKLSAEISFNCGNFGKADTAAKLLAKQYNKNTVTGCLTCGN